MFNVNFILIQNFFLKSLVIIFSWIIILLLLWCHYSKFDDEVTIQCGFPCTHHCICFLRFLIETLPLQLFHSYFSVFSLVQNLLVRGPHLRSLHSTCFVLVSHIHKHSWLLNLSVQWKELQYSFQQIRNRMAISMDQLGTVCSRHRTRREVGIGKNKEISMTHGSESM